MSGKTFRLLLVTALVVLAFSVVLVPAFAQGTTVSGTTTSTLTSTTTSGGAAGAAVMTATATATPRTLPTTGDANPANTMTVVLLALGATAGLGGLLLRGLRQPQR